MNNEEAAKILAEHNAWRRDGDELYVMQHPKVIGEAIDHAVAVLRALGEVS